MPGKITVADVVAARATAALLGRYPELAPEQIRTTVRQATSELVGVITRPADLDALVTRRSDARLRAASGWFTAIHGTWRRHHAPS